MSAGEVVSAASYSDEAVKAAFLYRFAAYVEWPPAPARDAFVIAVVDADGVANELARLLPGRPIQGRRAEVRRPVTIADLDGVSILYVGPGSLSHAQALVAEAQKRPILIVTDERGGLAHGGIINFVQVRQNVRMEVSLSAADRSGIRINSGLLAVAVRVEGRPQADTHSRLERHA